MKDNRTEKFPLVSIITPSFNQAQFIRETIESVLTQDYPNVEYLIMDGASTDGTAEVARPYGDRLTFISEPDNGQSQAINRGFRLARGEIVAWLNSDDVFLPGAISSAVRALESDPRAGVVYGEGYQIDHGGAVKQRFPFTQHFDLWKLTFVSDYILQQTVFFRKSALDQVGPIREDLHFVMDWDILIRLGKRFPFIHLPDFMGAIREYEAAKTSSGGAKRAAEIRGMLEGHTGMRFAPGYLIYGFSAYEQILVQKIDAWPKALRPLGRPLRSLVSKLCHKVISYAMTQGQGWHRDGWIAPDIHVMLPEGNGEAVLTGELPGLPALVGQALTVSCDNQEIARFSPSPGPFEMRFTVDGTKRNPVLRIRTSKSFSPMKEGISGDARVLGLRLLDLRWAAEGNR